MDFENGITLSGITNGLLDSDVAASTTNAFNSIGENAGRLIIGIIGIAALLLIGSFVLKRLRGRSSK